MSSAPLGDRLHWLERCFVGILLVSVVGVGTLTYLRTVLQERRKGDLTVYLRAAHAVQTGQNLYEVKDHNQWHYHYPPLLAILMVPLAEPPPQLGEPAVPFAATVIIWYLLNVAALLAAVHWLASALEDRLGPSSTPRRWWWLWRILPILACVVPIGNTLVRGQVNLLLIALICAMAAALLRGRHALAGLALAGAICLKIIPVFLLLYPIWKRDYRCLAGCALGLAIGLGAIPLAVFGPQRTTNYYVILKERVLEPGLGHGQDRSRARELTNMTATASQSFQSVIHRWQHVNPKKRPPQAADETRLIHWGLGGLLTLVVLAAAGWWRTDSPGQCVLTIGLLTTLMVTISPVAHMHYFALNLVLIVGILAVIRERHGTVAPGVEVLLGLVYPLLLAIPHWPERFYLRELGLTLFTTLVLAGVGVALLWRVNPTVAAVEKPQPIELPLAA